MKNITVYFSKIFIIITFFLIVSSCQQLVVNNTTTSVSTPSFSVATGTYSSNQTISIFCQTSSSSIYYTTDGTSPSTTSFKYSTPISVNGNGTVETINAIGVESGMINSKVATATYTIVNNSQVSIPIFNPIGGTYSSNQIVSISSATPSATIYYTTDGSSPTTSSSVYTTPISVAGDGTTLLINAIATAPGLTMSSMTSSNYVISYNVSHSIYVSAGDGLHYSNNNGSSWTLLSTQSPYYGNNTWLYNPGLYVVGSNIYITGGIGVFLSSNGGSSWTDLGPSNSYARAVLVSGSTIYVPAQIDGLYISVNGGASWNNYTSSNGLGGQVERVYISGSTIYAATLGGVSISTNGGVLFTNYNVVNGLASNSVNDIFVVGSKIYAATTNGLSISTTGGTSWTNYSTTNGLLSNTINNVYATSTEIYAGTAGGLSVSKDSGNTWTTYTTANGLGSNNIGKIFVFGNTLYAEALGSVLSSTYGGISISTNGGTVWVNYPMSPANPVLFVQ
jgi:hypothetical protein